MNTSVGDALALGWVLGAVVNGWGMHKLFEAYDSEQRPIDILVVLWR